MAKEQKFFDALRDVFVGAKVEGESGYINLMRIKSRYYEAGVFPKLQQDINEALKAFPVFREEMFDKLFDFFHRYFSESGSIYFRYTPLHQNVYEKVYTNDKDVMLFWKTHMLYYVKTDRLFRGLDVELDGMKFHFDVSTLEHKKANEKRNIVYSFKEKRKDALVFEVAYSERGRITKVDDILRTLRKQGVAINEDTLERAFRVFEKQSEVDYFINKDAKAFLEEQFNLWQYQYMFSGVSEWTETRIKQLQTLKDIAFKIIAFISQFENELVKIWNKPKFVLNSNYVITLDRIAEKESGIALVEKLLAHKNFKAQIEEWQQLGIVDDSFKKSAVLEKESKGKRLAKPYQHLPVDTKHFKDLELNILGLFDNLDQALDGWLIKSENYQALNTILPKFREKIKCAYIDPPYNTGSDEFIYRDRFQHSSWLSMMADRLALARKTLVRSGALFAQIGDEEQANLKALMEEVFGSACFRNAILIRRGIKNVQSQFEDISALSIGHDTLLLFSREPKSRFPKLSEELSEGEPGKWDTFWRGTDRKTMRYELFGIKPDKGQWRWSEERAKKAKAHYETYLKSGVKLSLDDFYLQHLTKTGEELDFVRLNDEAVVQYYVPPRNYKLMSDIWIDVRTRGDFTEFPTEKHTELIGTIVRWMTDKADIVVDFFAGSGTTGHAVLQVNCKDNGKRKYILVETGEWFDSYLLPRMKKAIFIEKANASNGVSHLLKYYQLEQYEDALRRAKYDDADLFDDPSKDPYHQYVFLRDLKMLETLEVDIKKNKVEVDLSKLYDGVDIAETLSNLTGKWIKRITADSVEFDDGEVVDTKNLDWKRIKSLIWW